MHTLVVPPAAQRDNDAVQMSSSWIAENGLHCSINVGLWHKNGKPELFAWGILLADVVRHRSNAMGERYGAEPQETIDTVVSGLLAELENPTSAAHGTFSAGHS